MNKRKSDIKRLLLVTAVIAIGISIFKSDSRFSWFGPSSELGHLLFGFLTVTVLLIFAHFMRLKFLGRFAICALFPAIFFFAWVSILGDILMIEDGKYAGTIQYFGLATIPFLTLTVFFLAFESLFWLIEILLTQRNAG